ncbi:MAG: two-component system sensor histidine kinase ChvG [Gammaproteobacteria bacterium]|jgi:two-component system sensor histidine kinase ChvG
MTVAPKIDIHDLESVRAAARTPDVLLGEDWVAPQPLGENELGDRRRRRGFFALRRSPIARKIITFNLIAMMLLIAGVLYVNSSRDTLAYQRAIGLVSEAELVADVFEAKLPANAPVNLISGDGIDVQETLAGLNLNGGIVVSVYDPQANLIAMSEMRGEIANVTGLTDIGGGTFLTDLLTSAWNAVALVLGSEGQADVLSVGIIGDAAAHVGDAIIGGTHFHTVTENRNTRYFVTSPIMQGATAVGVVSVQGAAGELDALVRREREKVLRLFLVGLTISIVLSLILASTIANPLADLAAAAEIGRDKNARKMSPTRVRIPDLSARPDEIGRLSGALRGMVSALYERIEGNEQFAADVAHEIKNPLASLRSAVGTMRVAKRDDQRETLLEVIEHDVRRLDRLVSDISNASRLDSELVKEEEETFNLLKMLGNLNEFLGREAQAKGIDYISDLPDEPINVQGLEGRLAQVFVNLITNATSFCEDGDAIRVWARRRKNRVLIVVEDTGPGIPNEALTKVFKRFYSERPEGQFGNNSGLGLAISKQIVEAHGGVIWAENIRPSDADMTSEPLGARFVVGLPV